MIDIRRRTTYFFLLVSLGHVLLISAQVQSKSGMPLLEHAAFTAFTDVQRGAAGIADAAGAFWGRYVALHGVTLDNQRLREQIAVLQGQLQQQAALAARATLLEASLRMQQSVSQRTVAARVIGGDPAPGDRIITIDRGSDDGVRVNLGVIAPGGVVGRVMRDPGPHTARVQLLTGRNAGAGGLLETAQAEGVVIGGSDDPPMRMQYVNKSYDVKAGERVLTSGHDGVFPAGFVIGTVQQVDRGSGKDLQIAVRPAVNFSHLDVVLVLLDAPTLVGGGGPL